MRRVTTSVGLTAALLLAGGGTAVGAAEDEYFGLPEDTGREEVIAYCGPCHSLKLVVQQGQTRAGWEEVLIWMYEEQEMPKLEAAEEKRLLDYLATHVNPESQKRRLRDRGILR